MPASLKEDFIPDSPSHDEEEEQEPVQPSKFEETLVGCQSRRIPDAIFDGTPPVLSPDPSVHFSSEEDLSDEAQLDIPPTKTDATPLPRKTEPVVPTTALPSPPPISDPANAPPPRARAELGQFICLVLPVQKYEETCILKWDVAFVVPIDLPRERHSADVFAVLEALVKLRTPMADQERKVLVLTVLTTETGAGRFLPGDVRCNWRSR
jgi:hypothetical protein